MGSDILPPLPCWPPEVFPDEPAHAFFRRLAEANGQISARTMASTFGLNGRNVRPQEFVSFCESFPVRNVLELAKASAVVEGNYATLSDQVFTISRDISFQHPRVCGACVAEQRYYRNWFDLAVVSRCPFHDLPLQGDTGGASLAWWYPPVAMTPSGDDLTVVGVERQTAVPETWERYVLGRIGAAEPFSVPYLDDQPMWQVTYVTDVVGLAALDGWADRGSRDRLEKYDPRRGAALRLGFDILREGDAGLSAFLARLSSSRPAVDGEPRVGIAKFYGNFRATVVRMPDFPLAERLKSRLEAVAKQHGVVSRKERPAVTELGAAAYTLNEVAGMLKLKVSRTRLLAQKGGIISALPSKSERHWITESDFTNLRKLIDSLVARPEAARMIGLTPSQFRDRCSEKGLEPFIRLWGPGQNSDRFLKADLITLCPVLGDDAPSAH